MNYPKISVIIPIYNNEDYLEETLNSLVNQSIFQEIEVIMIDDGSNDYSRYISEKYALDYDNFKVYHKENEGQGVARNFGLTVAKGDYIHFMDSDDYLPPNAYELLYDIALKNNNDIIIGNVLRFARYNVWEDFLFKNSFKNITSIVESQTLNEIPQILWDTITCNKLYKKEFILKQNIKFPENVFFEDILFSFQAYVLAESISISPEIFYYWRLRSNETSVTQQDHDLRNFKDRLYILKLIINLFDEYDLNDDLIRFEYLKWINHDLKFNIKRFNYFPENSRKELFNEIYELVKNIPEDLIDGLNSYKKVVFKMIKNKDYDNFIKFAPLENELFENPIIPSFLNDEYSSYFNFNEALKNEELICDLNDVMVDDNNLIIDFSASINYLTNEKFEIIVNLIDDSAEYLLNLDENSNIILPFDLINDKNHLKIKINYIFADFEKQTYLKNRHRHSIHVNDLDIDLDMGLNSYLFINVRHKNNNEIKLTNVEFEKNNFFITGQSINPIKSIYMVNIINFKKFTYNVDYTDEKTFNLCIPYNDILSEVIKKWELNSIDSINSIKIPKFEFYTKYHKIRFISSRNKILIENDLCNLINESYNLNSKIEYLNSQIGNLKSKNKQLTKRNKKLRDDKEKLIAEIDEFRARKVVKIADKLQNIKNRR